MAEDSVRGVTALQTQIERAKESLKDVDENIKKLTGRDPLDRRPGRRISLSGELRGRERLFNQARRGIENNAPAQRQVMGTAFSRLGPPRSAGRGRPRADSGDEEDFPNKPAVQSSVVITPKDTRSRKDSIEEQNTDKKGNARNKRMFGLLLGTLRKFKDEAKETEDREVQRKKIELKLEEKAKQEKEEIKKERRQLFIERKQQQFKIQQLEQKMELVEMHDEWEKETRKLVNFLRTKAKPHIFYMPKMMMPLLTAKLEDTKVAVEEMIAEKRKRLEQEIENLMVEDAPEGHDDEETIPEDHQDDQTEPKVTDKENVQNRNRRLHPGGENSRQRRESESSPTKIHESSSKAHESPKKSHSKEYRRKSNDESQGRRVSLEESRKRRQSSGDRHVSSSKHRRTSDADDSKHRRTSDADDSKHRRRSDGDGKSGRDRHHRSDRKDSHKAKRDDQPREVKINYDDQEMEEENQAEDSKGKLTEAQNAEGIKTENLVKYEPSEPLKIDPADIQLPDSVSSEMSAERKIVMAEDAEDGEEGGSLDAIDE